MAEENQDKRENQETQETQENQDKRENQNKQETQEKQEPREKRQKRRRWGWRQYAMLVLAVIFVVSGGKVLWDLNRSSKEQEANQQLAERVRQAKLSLGSGEEEEAPEEADPPPKYAPNGNLTQYDALWQENHDLAGWLYIPGTQVNLPVMNNPSDPEFYLRRAFDGSRATSGCLFLGEGYRPDGNYALIYGHNMNNGTMFGHLKDYKDQSYAQEHPYVYFDTLTEERQYTVLAAFYSKVYYQNDTGVFRYYQYTDLNTEELFNEYISQVRKAALYDTGVDVQYGDQIVTLSTCSYHRKNGRFVVVACRTPDPAEDLTGEEGTLTGGEETLTGGTEEYSQNT